MDGGVALKLIAGQGAIQKIQPWPLGEVTININYRSRHNSYKYGRTLIIVILFTIAQQSKDFIHCTCRQIAG